MVLPAIQAKHTAPLPMRAVLDKAVPVVPLGRLPTAVEVGVAGSAEAVHTELAVVGDPATLSIRSLPTPQEPITVLVMRTLNSLSLLRSLQR